MSLKLSIKKFEFNADHFQKYLEKKDHKPYIEKYRILEAYDIP
jgi:hypothetical protein